MPYLCVLVCLQDTMAFPLVKLIKMQFNIMISTFQSIYLGLNLDLYPKVVLGMC